MGRRPLLLTSGTAMGITTGITGVFFYLDKYNDMTDLSWIPLASLVFYMIGYSVGFASIPFIMMGELFPSHLRSLFGGATSSFNLTNLFLVTKLLSNIVGWIDWQGVFWIYSGFSFLSVVFVFIFVPETKGKTMDEIQQYFKR